MRQSLSFKAKLILGIGAAWLLCAIIGLSVASVAATHRNEAAYSWRAHELAYLDCMPASFEKMKNVRFSTYENSSVTHDGDVYTVHGFVDLDADGGPVRHQFTTRLRRDPIGGKWTALGTSFLPPL